MNTPVHVQSHPEVERLAARLQQESSQAIITVIPEGHSHGGSEQLFSIEVLGKKLRTNSLLSSLGSISITDIQSMRTGPFVKTTIKVKVATSLVPAS